MLLLSIITLSTLFAFSNGLACFDNGDKEIGGSCYKFVSQQMTFNDARNWCHFQNPVTASYLAYVPNQFTGNFLASYARSAFGQNDGNFWIGLSRQNSSSPWLWDAGFPLVFTNFDGSQLGQNYAAESMVSTKWGTYGQDELKNFVCSYDPSAPPTFGPATALPETTARPIITTTAQNVPTTTEDYDDFCNIGEKHSTFLLAYATDFDPAIYNSFVNQFIIPAITSDRHNYTKLARARFDTKTPEDISYSDDVASYQNVLISNPPVAGLAADPANPSNVLSVISSFLSATGRPLESSMIIILINRFPQIGVDLTQAEYDKITINNVKIFPIINYAAWDQEFPISSRSYQSLSNLASNSNGQLVIGDDLLVSMQQVMATAYTNSLAFSRNIGKSLLSVGSISLGTMRIPRSRLGFVNFTVTVTVESMKRVAINTGAVLLRFRQSGSADQYIDLEQSLTNTNFYYGYVTLKPNIDCSVILEMADVNAGNVFVRVWTPSITYHYGSFTAIDDPMGGNALSQVDEYGGAALRMRLMNDCYTDYGGSIIITDCNGVISPKYDSSQSIPPQYIFADEGSFPHYPFIPYFCDSTPPNSATCVQGSQSKYDIQFVAGEFTVVRSFQCRPGVGSVKCPLKDSNGNYYCARDKLPYMRGPTGELVDCLGHGHLEFDFFDTQTYVCVCDQGYSGDSCQQSN